MRKTQSIPQTRLHFQSIIASFSTEPTSTDAAPYIQWQTDTTPHVPDPPEHDPAIARVKTSQSGSASRSGKGKDRASGEGVAGPSGTRSLGGKGHDSGAGGVGSGAKGMRKSGGGGGR